MGYATGLNQQFDGKHGHGLPQAGRSGLKRGKATTASGFEFGPEPR
jgi:hypothetical protein